MSAGNNDMINAPRSLSIPSYKTLKIYLQYDFIKFNAKQARELFDVPFGHGQIVTPNWGVRGGSRNISNRIKALEDLKRSKQINNGTKILQDKVLSTSESSQVLKALFDYPKNDTFPFDFIVNEKDVGQGSGNPRSFNKSNFKADDVMMTSLVTLKMQLFPDSLVVNYCSYFHNLIGAFVSMGCGYTNYIEGLSQNDNPELRVGCFANSERKKKKNGRRYFLL
jgi:hypothetical protein